MKEVMDKQDHKVGLCFVVRLILRNLEVCRFCKILLTILTITCILPNFVNWNICACKLIETSLTIVSCLAGFSIAALAILYTLGDILSKNHYKDFVDVCTVFIVTIIIQVLTIGIDLIFTILNNLENLEIYVIIFPLTTLSIALTVDSALHIYTLHSCFNKNNNG